MIKLFIIYEREEEKTFDTMRNRVRVTEGQLHNLIKECVRGVINSGKIMLNEGITDITYHFCSLSSLYSILESGKLGLTMSSNSSDAYHKTKLFYLSTQRSKFSRIGYAGNSSGHGKYPIVRIELNGAALKQDGYQGIPLDYWGATMGKQSDIGLNSLRIQSLYGSNGGVVKPMSQKDKETILKSQQTSSNFEFEDRIFSNKPSISLKYINRIDCLIPNGEVLPIEKAILGLANNRGISVQFYDNEKDFIRETDRTINQSIISSVGDYEAPNKGESDERRLNYNAKTVAILSAVLLYYDYHDDIVVNGNIGEETLSKLSKTLNKFGLDRYYDYCVKEIPDIEQFIERYIGESLDDTLRKANTNSLTKNSLSENVMLYAQYVFNYYSVNSCSGLRMYIKNHPWKKNKPIDAKIEESVKCIELNYGNSPSIFRADKVPFWGGRWFDKDDFYRDISRQLEDDDWNEQNGYGDDRTIHHKSKNSQSFLKYLKFLMHNDNLSLYDGTIILNKIFNYDQGKISAMFGFSIKPIEIDKDSFIKYENNITWDDRESVRNSLFGDEESFYSYMFKR